MISSKRSSTVFNCLLLLIFVFYLLIIYKDYEIANDGDQQWTIPNFHRNIYDKGIAVCANGDSITTMTGLYYIIRKLRTEFKSNIHIEIAHCNEISDKTKQSIRDAYVNILFNNICEKAPTVQKKRLRGWFCKPMALITSSFNETMVIDADTMWFQNPIDLFNSYGYLDTGALFFRDRLLYELKEEIDNPQYDQRKGLRLKDVLTFIETHNSQFKLTSDKALELYHNNGAAYFWKHGFNNSAPILRQVQESSVILMNRNKMIKTTHILSKIIPYFGLGYGDKEMYWIAATIANEKVSWEPYIAGIYGDCGQIFHYSPIKKYQQQGNDDVKPYFLNAESLEEISTSKDGRGIQNILSKPVLASNFELFEMGAYFKETGGRCGACERMGCQSVPDYFNNEIMNYQRYQRIHIANKITSFDKITRKLKQLLEKLIDLI